jgi:RNAse (barnase) inhibitor barstar
MSMPARLEPEKSGVYRTPADTADLRARAAAGAATWREVELARVRSKQEVLRAFAEALDFPSHFGANWDALEDCLEDSDWLPGAGHVIHLRGADAAQRALGAQWDTLLDILREASTYWKERGKPFIVLVDGVAGLPSWT